MDSKNPPILLYHKIDDRWEWGITRQRVGQFGKQMSFLYDEGYKLVGLEKDLSSDPKEKRKEVFLTFDDGYESVYINVFPVLERLGFSATVFLITGWVGKNNLWDVNWGRKFKHLSWSQVEELNGFGFNFGSHTVNHPDLTKLTDKELEYELLDSKNILEDRLGKRVEFLSYPFGRYNQKVKRIAQKAGYRYAFTICPDSEDPFDPYAKGRLGVYLFDTKLTLNIKLNHTPLFWIEKMKGRIVNQFATGTALFKGTPKYDFRSKRKISPVKKV